MGGCLSFGFHPRWSLHPPVFQMFGASELPLSQPPIGHRSSASRVSASGRRASSIPG